MPSLREQRWILGAHRVLDRLGKLIGGERILSAVDFGCGLGAWLRALAELGVADLVGVDQSREHRPPGSIEWAGKYHPADLAHPLDLRRLFDLAICVEVAEHLAPEAAAVLVETITRHADLVLFSAAIPGQGGDHHVNEQWPEYWAERFNARGFAACDSLRFSIWQDPEILWWYRQNTVIYFRRSGPWKLAEIPPLPVAHPLCYDSARRARPGA